MTESQKRAESTRGRFEEWAIDRGWDVSRCNNGTYTKSSTELLWTGWKAAVRPANCLACREPLSSNGLIAWCDNGHVWELPQAEHSEAYRELAKGYVRAGGNPTLLADDSFVHKLEKRSMSSWTNEEMQRYNELTGQGHCKHCGSEITNNIFCESCGKDH